MVNQIELIQKLYAKTKTYKIPKEPKEGIDQIDIEITPLSLEDMGALNMKEDMPLSELSKNAKIMFSKSLGITEDAAAKISFAFMEDLLSAVMDANNFKEDDLKKTGIKDFIKKKQEQMQKGETDDKSDRPA
jgi:hypothetical protein